jgi:hypothetical protein
METVAIKVDKHTDDYIELAEAAGVGWAIEEDNLVFTGNAPTLMLLALMIDALLVALHRDKEEEYGTPERRGRLYRIDGRWFHLDPWQDIPEDMARAIRTVAKGWERVVRFKKDLDKK